MSQVSYQDASQALRVAYSRAPAVIGWKPGGWLVYSPISPSPPAIQPELLVLRPGLLPIFLSDSGREVFESIVTARLS